MTQKRGGRDFTFRLLLLVVVEPAFLFSLPFDSGPAGKRERGRDNEESLPPGFVMNHTVDWGGRTRDIVNSVVFKKHAND